MQLISAHQNLNTNDNHHSLSFYLFLAWAFILIGRPQDFISFLVPFRISLVFTCIALFATLIEYNGFPLKRIFETSESKKYTLLYCIMIFGIPFAYHRRIAFEGVFPGYSVNMLFYYIFIVQVNSIKKLKKVFFTICLSILLYSISTLATGTFSQGIDAFGELQDRRFSAGPIYDPNDIAYFFVSMLPIVSFFILKREALYKKIIAAISIAASLYVILLTGSRGGFLALVAVLILFVFTKSGGLKVSHKISLIVCLIIGLACYGHKIDMDRYLSITTNMEDDYNLTDEFGRIAIWKRALKLTISNPISGVGFNCFGMAIGYDRMNEGVIPIWQAAHNSYVQIAAELGLMGFAIFISIIIGCLNNFSRCMKANISHSELQEIINISGLLRIGFIGSLIAAFFLTQGYNLLFALFFAFSAVLTKLELASHRDPAA